MDRRTKAAHNKDKAPRLNEAWRVGAVQARYSDDGHWYATLTRFPAALFDASGYLLFATEEEYRNSTLSIGKQISIRKPGISAIRGYIRVIDANGLPDDDVDIHSFEATEGHRQLITHLRRERNQTLVRKKKKFAASLQCEVCGFSFSRDYGRHAADYCEVHHLLPLAEADKPTTTRMQDLAIVCANCHRVIHLRNPPYTLLEIRGMLSHQREDG